MNGVVETDYIGGGGGEVLPSTLAHTLLGPWVPVKTSEWLCASLI